MQQSDKLSKTLLPLILLLMLVILLTLIASNLRPEGKKNSILKDSPVPETGLISQSEKLINPQNFQTDQPREEQMLREAIQKWKSGGIDQAESDFRTILIFDPDNLTALSCLATIFYHQGKFQEAELLFRKKTEAYPGSPYGHRNLALTLFRLDRLNDAVIEMKRASALDPSDMETLLNLARLYAYTGDDMNAAVCLKRAKENGVDLSEVIQENVFHTLKAAFSAYFSGEEDKK